MIVGEFPSSDLYRVVLEFVQTFALPKLGDTCIFQGWGNKIHLPADTNEFAVMSAISTRRIGTTVEKTILSDEEGMPDKNQILTLFETQVQVDFCSDTDAARIRAERFTSVGNSATGVQFMKERGISLNFTEDMRDLSFVAEDQLYTRRWMSIVRLSYWSGVEVNTETFETVEINIFKPLHEELN
jgi:hypothetical protein